MFRIAWILVFAPLLLGACGPRHSGGGSEARNAWINGEKDAAALLIQEENFEEAVRRLEPLTAQRVRDPQVYSMLAGALWRLGSYEDAVENFEASLRLDYTESQTHLNLAQLLVEMNKTGRALTEFQLAIRHGKGEALPHYNYGLALHELGRTTEALGEWQIAHDLDRTNPMYAEALGIGMSGVDDESALEFFKLADELGADSRTFHNNFGILLGRLGEKRRAAEEFRKAIARDPENDEYKHNLAALYMNSGDFGAALPLWTELHGCSEDNADYRIYRARALLELGRFGEAIDLLGEWARHQEEAASGEAAPRPAHTRKTGLDEAYGILAMSHRGIGELDTAVILIEKAIRLHPSSPAHLNNYGVILAESGKIEQAKAQWERVLELEPNNDTARRNLSAFGR
jgi:tetratricopeptide (TPR) repeat protein